MATVRLTLLKSLFIEDAPFFGDLMAEHENHIFPGREDFILFLEEADAQKRTDLAKRLLSRLARESGIFVPFGLILALLQAEEQYAPSTVKDIYVPQDHFCHLVQLYLLGIYLFTHHKKLHRSITKFFKRQRETINRSCSSSSEESAFFDFLFAWRSFVLLHDIGYPIELPPLKNNSLIRKIRTGHSNIRDLVCDETALAFLSRMITWELIEEQVSRVTCGAVAPKLFLSKEHGNELTGMLPGDTKALHIAAIKHWHTAERIPFLHGRRFASLSAHMRPTDEVLALLVHRRSGEPSLALVPDGSGNHVVINLQNAIRLSAKELCHHAFELGTTPCISEKSEEYEWQMFIKNYDAYKSSLANAIKELVKSYFSPELLHSVADALAKEAPDPLTTITSEADFLAYENWVYETIQNWWLESKQNPILPNGTIEDKVVSLCATSLAREISDHISGFIKNKIDENLGTSPQIDMDTILSYGIQKIVESVLTPILEDREICNEVTHFVYKKLHDKIDLELAKKNLFNDAKNMAKMVYKVKKLPKDKKCSFTKNPILGTLLKRISCASKQAQAVNVLLSESGLPKLEKLLKKYKPSYLKPCSIDHGLASAVCSLQITMLAEDFLTICKQNYESTSSRTLQAFTAISVCLGDETDIYDLRYRAQTLMPEVTRAIAMHNLYPKYLDELGGTSFRTDLHREPFCFFAMLCDSLQSWDRDRRLWQSEKKLQYKTSGDHYDISIVGDVIHVREHDYDLDVAKRAETIKNGLEGYLHSVKDYIWLDLAQWPEKGQQTSQDSKKIRSAASRFETHF